jgi:hypothetical protein
MKHQIFFKAILCCSVVVLVMLSAQARGQPASSRGRWLYGDYRVKVDFDGRQYDAILSFSRDREGNRTGQWISFWGLSELKDVKYEEGQLSFTRTSRSREGESITSKFTGTIKEGVLSGTMSSDRGESKLKGKRSPRTPRAVGSWEVNVKMPDREFTSTLVVKADKEGKLTAQWSSERGELEITDVQYERGRLTFKMEPRQGEDRPWEATFEGTIQRETDTLSGVIKSERGEITAEGKRIGAALIGTWDLDMESERGPRKQRLRVNPDMTGLYGTIPVKKVNLEDDKVSFKIVMEFGERKFEMTFEGKLKESKLTGELTTSRGTTKVTGTKVIRRFRWRSTGSTR